MCLLTIGIIPLLVCGRSEAKPASGYRIPLEEIAERIEYEYIYENMIYRIADKDYKRLSFLPKGEDITVSFYVVEGNKLLFLPEEKANTEAVIDNEPCKLHYFKEADGFVFYVLVDWQLSEEGVPVNSLEDDYYHRIRECIVRDQDAVYEETNLLDDTTFFQYEFAWDDLVRLGDTKVTFDPDAAIALQKVPVQNNEYMDAVAEYAAHILRERQKYGKFQICLETYGRVPGGYGECTGGKVTAAVFGEGYEDYLFFRINDDDGRITEDSVWPEYYPSEEDSPTYFVSEWYLEAEPEDFLPGIAGLQREVLELEVREEETAGEEPPFADEMEYNQEIDFRMMDSEEIAELINYVYSYEEWFGMNELGCQTGKMRELQGEKIAMYSWDNNGDSVFLVPRSWTNTRVKCGNRTNCPVYTEQDGELMMFYQLSRNGYAGEEGQLHTTFFMRDEISADYAEHMLYLGEAELTLRELPSLEVARIEEDAYISAFREYIADMLRRNRKSGEYEINIGEYEALHTNKVCLSAAVSGEGESWYFRYMIVKSEQGNYYFWPAGFGLNSSLGECEVQRHYMNALCMERTKRLARNRIMITV